MFCQKCGTQLADDTKFCPKCGNAIQGANEASDSAKENAVANNSGTKPQSNQNAKHLHCPNCKSVNINITTESSVTGGVTSHTGGASVTSFSNTHRNFWICQDCGTKFRNIQSLEEEIAGNKRSPLLMSILSGGGAALTAYLLYMMLSETLGFLFFFYFMGALTFTIVTFIFRFVYKNRLKKLKAELEYLKKACFD